MQNNIFKYISIFLLGLILGFLIRDINFGSQAVSTITKNGSIKVMGNQTAPVTMVEYSDFQCPLCKKFYDENFSKLVTDYIKTGKIKYVFKQFPLNMHPQAPDAALASECALEQNKFWEMHDLLFENQASWSGKGDYLNTIKQFAKQLALNETDFNACMDTKKHQGNVEKDYQEGLTKGVRGTPTFYINDQILVGAQEYDKFTEMLDKALSQPTPVQPATAAATK